MNRTGQAITMETEADGKMAKSIERTLEGELVKHKESSDQPVADQKREEIKKSPGKRLAPRKAARKVRGKRSSQRNRACSFDFGI